MFKSAPYGGWPSPIQADMVANGSRRSTEPLFHHGYLYWIENRPQENGRAVIVRQDPTGLIADLLPSPWNARSKVHEYGGGAYALAGDRVYFVNADDQQIWSMNLDGGVPVPVSQAPLCRFADLRATPSEDSLLAVCEDHGQAGLPQNRLVRFDLGPSGEAAATQPAGRIIASGHDFYASPAVSPCGRWLVWLTWDHPHMPWDRSALWLQPLCEDQSPVCIAGGDASLFQPQWAPDGSLLWVSDQSNWWNLYRLDASQIKDAFEHQNAQPQAILPREAEFATPQWTFRMSTYGCIDENTLFAACVRQGHWQAGYLRRATRATTGAQPPWQFAALQTDLCSIANVTVQGDNIALTGSAPTHTGGVYRVEGQRLVPVSAPYAVSASLEPYLSTATPIEFPTMDGSVSHAFYYPPRHPECRGLPGTAPPVIVICHGGPTGMTEASLNFKIQYWTSRGFAILDVNYRGSTGFGRQYRQSLRGQWGVADVEDLAGAVQHIVKLGWANPDQCIIRGSSAGGFTVLTALTDTDTFSAGVSLYGIGDLEALTRDTHKFEAHYLDTLVGPYPENATLYRQRSPIYKVDQIACPLLVFQGLLDKVVPPNQAETMVSAVRQHGLPVAYVTYPDEAHGFRQADTIRHQLEAELLFYQRIFGWPTPDATAINLEIMNLPD